MVAHPNLRKLMKLSKKKIREILLESLFDPRDHTPFSFVVQQGNPIYAETKATELISEARAAYMQGSSRTYHEKMGQAIALLALARSHYGTLQG
jgi:hypothetical protein